MNGGPSGFHNAPVTKTLVIACGLLTLFVGIQRRSSAIGLSYQDIFRRFKLWRVILSSFAFSSTPELVFGLYLLYYFRVFERQIGSNKYSVFILFSTIATSLFGFTALALLKDPTLNILASGPYALIFSSFIPFYFDIPVTTRFRIFGFHFSDKTFIYLAGLQLILSSWKRSLVPGICGILAGSLYRVNAFGIRKIKFPAIIASFFSRLSWPSFSGGPSSTASSGNVAGNVPSFVGRRIENNYPTTVPRASTLEPSEDSIATLVSMGFDRNSARQALVQARNDINVATNLLLEAHSH